MRRISTAYRNARTDSCATPIMNRTGKIVAWTQDPPSVERGRVRHAAAEALLRSPVTCAYVQIVDHDSAILAGAPPYWAEPWRCLAIIPTEPEKPSR